MFNKAKCPGSGLARFAAAMRDIVIDIGEFIGENWKIIGYIDFTLTDHTEGAPNSKSDKLGKIVWYVFLQKNYRQSECATVCALES